VASGGSERAAHADLVASLEDADDHDVGDADAADEKGDAAEPEEAVGERFVEGVLGRQGV
jgi:hypothetical protein